MTTPFPLSPVVGEAQASPTQRFRKKPVEIQAMQWTGDNTSEVIDWVLAAGTRAARWHGATDLDAAAIAIDTLEGTMRASLGDWIIRGIQGEFCPCKPDIFAATYDVAPEPLELTPEEQAAKEKSEHMSTCHEEACVECMKELRVIRRIVKAIRPVIEDQAYQRGYGQGRDDEAADAPTPVAAALDPTPIPDGEE